MLALQQRPQVAIASGNALDQYAITRRGDCCQAERVKRGESYDKMEKRGIFFVARASPICEKVSVGEDAWIV
jgi:hypothetical protein